MWTPNGDVCGMPGRGELLRSAVLRGTSAWTTTAEGVPAMWKFGHHGETGMIRRALVVLVTVAVSLALWWVVLWLVTHAVRLMVP